MKVAEAIAKQMKDKVCYCCGRTENITSHHLRDIYLKTKSGKGVFNGYILLCRDCHDFVELINNKHRQQVNYHNLTKLGLWLPINSYSK